MAGIKLTAFSGEQPLIQPNLLPDTAAQSAIDLRMNDGGLTPVRQAVQITNLGGSDHKTILKFDGEWLSFANAVNAVQGPVAQDRLYFTGDGVPKMRVGGSDYDLAVPAPATALTLTVNGAGTGNVATRVYVYTWVTDFGEESEPSPPSAGADWQSGQDVTLAGFEATPSGRNITKQRIYRSQTGEVGTYLYFIAERNVSTSDYNDTIAVDAFNEPLPSADWNAPPDGLSGIVSLPGGVLAGFVGKDLYFSEPWRPHAWPEKYVQTTDFNIVALGAVGSALIVLTAGQPYYVTGLHPSAMRMDKIEQNLPCINARAVVDLGFAIAFPSPDGLVVIAGDGSARLISANLFDRDSWSQLSPSTAIAGQLGGRYVLFYDTVDGSGNTVAGALYIDVGGTPFLLRSSEVATAAWHDVTEGKLYFLKKGTSDVFELDPTSGSRAQYFWRSKEFLLAAPTNFGVIQVDGDKTEDGQEAAKVAADIAAAEAANQALLASGSINGEINALEINALPIGGDGLLPLPDDTFVPEISVYADGNVIKTINTLDKPIRLPGGKLARCWEVSARGRTTIKQIAIAHTISDLKMMT